MALRGGAGTPTQAGRIHTQCSLGGGLAPARDSQCIYEEGSLGQGKEHWSGSPETWLLISALTFDVFVIWKKLISLDYIYKLLIWKMGAVRLPACLP